MKLTLKHLFSFFANSKTHKEPIYLFDVDKTNQADNKQFPRLLEKTIVELNDTQKQLQTTREQLIQSQKLNCMGQLIAGVVHELNNPLTIMLGNIQLIRLEDCSESLKKELETVAGNARRCKKIVDNLLNAIRKNKSEKKKVYINHLIEQTLEMLEYEFRVENIKLERNLSPEIPVTYTDEHQIQQVLINILCNAYQALKNRNNKLIRVETVFKENKIVVSIYNNGPHIPDENLKNIFEPFFTTKSDGEGTGLGLFISKGIVEFQKGKMWVNNQSFPSGVIFVIELPVIIPEISSFSEEFQSIPESYGKNILLIDYETSILDLNCKILKKKKHKVTTVNNMDEVLRELEAKPYDLIISDTRKPDMDGLQLYKYLGKKFPHLKQNLIIITGYITDEVSKKFLIDNNIPFIIKPYEVKEFEHMVNKVLNQQTKDLQS
ncbi:MAG: ATP-binding protein [Elusimicrobia bacterium]|nr:ATP-binding protein [Elusimicrobiota bacterium]